MSRVVTVLGPGHVSRTVVAAVVLILLRCDAGEPFYQYGIEQFSAGDGSALYFKREVRGSNYDELWISSNADPCKPPDSSTDYVFADLGPLTVYCSTRAGVVQTYSTGQLEEPTATPRIRVVNHVVDPLAFQELERNYKTRGLTRIAVGVRSDIHCR